MSMLVVIIGLKKIGHNSIQKTLEKNIKRMTSKAFLFMYQVEPIRVHAKGGVHFDFEAKLNQKL